MSREAIILCVDDDASVLSALRTLLTKQGYRDRVVEIADNGEDALEIINELEGEGVELSVVIADYIMPGMKGDELLVRIHERYPDVVTIMLTGQSDLQGVKRAINEANLYRFLEKPFDNEDLALTVQGALKAYRQERALQTQNERLKRINEELEHIVAQRTRELVEKNHELERLSTTDSLTALPNRLRIDSILYQEFARSDRYHTQLSLILLDIDEFKSVNDTYGHPVGDSVLIEIGAMLAANVRHSDVAGRWGGEEFLIVCPEIGLDDAVAMADKLRLIIAAHPFPIVGHRTASFGVTNHQRGDQIKDMLVRADEALYRAKRQGRNRVESNP